MTGLPESCNLSPNKKPVSIEACFATLTDEQRQAIEVLTADTNQHAQLLLIGQLFQFKQALALKERLIGLDLVAVLGSARPKESSTIYQSVFKFAKRLGAEKIGTITGSGTGVMEAANAGTRAAGEPLAKAVGLSIEAPSLWQGEKPNDHIDELISFSEHLGLRKFSFMLLGPLALVFWGGGGGTMEELWTFVVAHQLGLIPDEIPILLIKNGKEDDYYESLIEGWVKPKMVQDGGFFSEAEFRKFFSQSIVTPDEAFQRCLALRDAKRSA
jgi:predicted Rossmann-fold nucleotide-binding protein